FLFSLKVFISLRRSSLMCSFSLTDVYSVPKHFLNALPFRLGGIIRAFSRGSRGFIRYFNDYLTLSLILFIYQSVRVENNFTFIIDCLFCLKSLISSIWRLSI